MGSARVQKMSPESSGLGGAAELAKKRMKEGTRYLRKLRDKLIGSVLRLEESNLNGHPENRLPNNAHFRFSGVEGKLFVLLLDKKGIAASYLQFLLARRSRYKGLARNLLIRSKDAIQS